jgi:hypothetical protein
LSLDEHDLCNVGPISRDLKTVPSTTKYLTECNRGPYISPEEGAVKKFKVGANLELTCRHSAPKGLDDEKEGKVTYKTVSSCFVSADMLADPPGKKLSLFW